MRRLERAPEDTDAARVVCDMDVKDDLFEAAESGTASEVKAALSAGADPAAARTGFGATPLHYAARNSNPSVITALIEAGADPAARDCDGKVPFDRLKENDAFEALRETDAYRLLNEARFE